MTCKEHYVPLEKLEEKYNSQDLQSICRNIESDVFLNRTIPAILDSHLASLYLNVIDRSDPFCQEIHQVYSHCSFCYEDHQRYLDCQSANIDCTPGLLPTADEVINDTTAEYARFRSRDDITTACLDIEKARNSYVYYWSSPTTIDLCDQQRLVYHLCDGQCGPRCFNSTHPPTCEEKNQLDNNLTVEELENECWHMRNWFLNDLDNRDIFNTSRHFERLQKIGRDSDQCTLFQQAYPHCFWCKSPEVLCFNNEEKRPTCDVPDNAIAVADDDDIDDVEETCQEIFDTLSSPRGNFLERFNLSYQANQLFIFEGTPECDKARNGYHKCLWCHPEVKIFYTIFGGSDNSFEDYFCHRNISFSVPQEYTLNVLEQMNISGFKEALTVDECETLGFDEWLWSNSLTPKELNETIAAWNLCLDYFCEYVRQPVDEPPRVKGYLGTTTEAQKNALIWASRSSAFLSFFGAIIILIDILRNPKSRKTVYHQILLGMATFDLVTAVAWGFATAPIAANEGVKGAIGTEETCTAQAFFIQLGFTSVFYNLSLAIYYVLVIVFSWREFQLKNISIYLHAVPLMVGLGLAFGGITSYSMLEYGCHLSPPPDGELWPILVFVVVPLGVSILAITGCMMGIYWSVRKQAQAAKKWNLGATQATKMEKAVFWQCVSYVLAFCITWPIMFSVYIASVDAKGPFGLALTVAFVAPLQGFSNSVVYLRTKLKTIQRSSLSSGRPSVLLSRMFAKLKPKESRTSHTSQAVHNRPEVDDDSLSGMDPSAALALHRDRISEQEASRVCSEPIAVNSSVIREAGYQGKINGSYKYVSSGVIWDSIDEHKGGEEAHIEDS